MINKESIISSFNDKPTLLEWLKKVEAALKGASASSFKVNKQGNATLTFSIVFDDGSEIESGPLTLEQGESVQSAAIRNGHLFLTLTNGDELDAGDLGGVSGFSINASQHLIVTYQNGTTQDLGAIFSGDIVISDGGISIADGAVSTPILTSANDHIEAQKPVIEVMNGYTFSPKSVNDVTLEYVYAGACKNGNKLTIALSLFITRTGNNVPNSAEFAGIILPEEVRTKLIPVAVGGYSPLTCFKVSATKDALNFVDLSFMCVRGTYGLLLYIMNGTLSNLSLNDKFYLRVEMTYLLSENLAA